MRHFHKRNRCAMTDWSDEEAVIAACEALVCPDVQQSPLTYVLQAFPVSDTGLLLEFGVFRGRTITQIATRYPDRAVYGFDSFQGLPEDWDRPDLKFPTGTFGMHGLPTVPANVTLVPGWFSDTLPSFVEAHASDTVALVHIDCDLYSSTTTVLKALAPMFIDGTVVVFDELFNYPNYHKHEFLALLEFLDASKFKAQWIGKHGPLIPRPSRDNGAWDQPAALVLRSK